MKIKEIMTQKFEMIDVSDHLTEAAKKMKTLNVGILPVKKDNKLVGMISDRDIVTRALAENQDLSSVHVKEIMSSDVMHCSSEDTIEDAAEMMKERQIRRLVVLDTENKPVGIVSLGDIAAKAGSEQLTGVILEGVSEPCCPTR